MSTAESDTTGWLTREIDAMATTLRLGESVRAEDVLSRHPEIDDEDAIRLIYEEVCLRREAGEEVASSEVVSRFPQFGDALGALLSCERLLGPTEPSAFPEVGEPLGDFQLLAELGRGSAGRTFLAAQPALADRAVALKVTAIDNEEHLSLARLQHAHIVPLYSEHRFPGRNLRGLCMPNLGGTNLARVLAELANIPPARRRGVDLIRSLDRLRLGATPAASGPVRRYLEGETYVRAVCWMAACLADALQYAHDRGLVHMDVKPSNILIADDGQPMLLDFHLAREPIAPGPRPPGRIGGTAGWMAPEQREAFEAVRADRPIPKGVDARADLYALGLVLREALSGPVAVRKGSAQELRRRNPEVSPGLADLVARCLEDDPTDRYPSANALAEDLRRHLRDLPLRGVANRSPRELWAKWRRRRPNAWVRSAAAAVLLGAGVAVAALGWAWHQDGVRQYEEAIDADDRLGRVGQFDESIRILSRARERVSRDPTLRPLASDLDTRLRHARRGHMARQVHEMADRVRLAGVGPNSADDEVLRTLLGRLRPLWGRPDLLNPPAGASLGHIAEEQLRRDAIEIAVAWAATCRGPSKEGRGDLRSEALGQLDALAKSAGPSLALDRERLALAESMGLSREPSPAPPARTAWEFDQLGRSFLRDDRLAESAEQFRRAIAIDPHDFWSQFDDGLCAYRAGRAEDAIAAFRTCVALDPKAPECRFNRALAYEAISQDDQALADYDEALRLDPKFAPAVLNRGILHHRAGREAEAQSDLRRVIAGAPGRELLGRAYYNLALVDRSLDDPTSAREHARQASSLGDADAAALLNALR